jgi:hypothetical protein
MPRKSKGNDNGNQSLEPIGGVLSVEKITSTLSIKWVRSVLTISEPSSLPITEYEMKSRNPVKIDSMILDTCDHAPLKGVFC